MKGATQTNGTPRRVLRNSLLGIINNNSLHDTAERLSRQRKAKNAAYKLQEGCEWADLMLQVQNAKPHSKRSKQLLTIIKMADWMNAASTMAQRLFWYFNHQIQPDHNFMNLGLFNNF